MIDSYDKLTIGKYLELMTIASDDTLEDIDRNVSLIALLDDKEVDVVYDLPLSEFNDKIQMTSFLYNEPKPTQVSTIYKLGGMELEAMLDVYSITTGQFIDYQTYVKDSKYLAELLSVFLIPKGKKYNKEYDIIEVQRVIRDNMVITQAMGLSAFFLHYFKGLLKGTETCLKRKLKKLIKKEKNKERKEDLMTALQSLENSGVGYL